MAFASNAFGQLRYVAESTPTVIPGSGGTNLRQTGMTLKAAISSVKSDEIRQDRLATGSTNTDLSVDGGFNFEMSGKEYDPFLCNLLGQAAFTHYGTLGLASIAGAVTAAAGTFTGTSIPTANLGLGQWFKVVPPVAATAAQKLYYADAWFKTHSVTAVSATVITLDPSTPVAAAGLGALGSAWGVSTSIISNGSTFTTFAMEYALSDITQYLTFTGLQTNTFDLSLDVGSVSKGSFGFMGRGHTMQATPLITGSAASQTLEVMNGVTDIGAIYEGGTSILGATSFIKSLKLNVNNNTRAQKALGVYGTVGVGYGELAIGGTLEVFVENAAYYQKWLQGTNTSLAVGMSDAQGNGYMFELDKVKFKDGGMNTSGRDDVMLSLPFDAFVSPTTSRGIRITRAIAA